MIPVVTWGHKRSQDAADGVVAWSVQPIVRMLTSVTYKPIVETFCTERSCFGVSRGELYGRVVMLLAAQLATEQSGQTFCLRVFT